MPGHGYKLQEQNFIVGVTHAAGMHELTWGMWTTILTSMMGYVQAYPGYDFLFEIRLMEGGELAGFVVGAGFAMTRGWLEGSMTEDKESVQLRINAQRYVFSWTHNIVPQV